MDDCAALRIHTTKKGIRKPIFFQTLFTLGFKNGSHKKGTGDFLCAAQQRDWTFFAPPPSATLTNTMNSNFDNAVLRASLEAAIDDSLEAEINDSLEAAIDDSLEVAIGVSLEAAIDEITPSDELPIKNKKLKNRNSRVKYRERRKKKRRLAAACLALQMAGNPTSDPDNNSLTAAPSPSTTTSWPPAGDGTFPLTLTKLTCAPPLKPTWTTDPPETLPPMTLTWKDIEEVLSPELTVNSIEPSFFMNGSRMTTTSHTTTLPGTAQTHEDIRSFGEQPSQNDQRHLEPECRSSSEHEKSRTISDVCQSLSPITSDIALNFSDEEEIGAWIWKTSRTARLSGANSSEELL